MPFAPKIELHKNKSEFYGFHILHLSKYWRTYSSSPKRLRPGSDELSDLVSDAMLGNTSVVSKLLAKSNRTKRCAFFCNTQKALYKCRSCEAHSCMKKPSYINGRSFPQNGPCCHVRYHGFSKFPQL